MSHILKALRGESILKARGRDSRDYMAPVVGVQGMAGAGDCVHRLPHPARCESWQLWGSAPVFKGLGRTFAYTSHSCLLAYA